MQSQVISMSIHESSDDRVLHLRAPLLREPGQIAYFSLPSKSTTDAHFNILMVHANGFLKEIWLPIISKLRLLGVTYSITACDLRSHGDSSPEPMNDWWTDLPKDISAVITQENSRARPGRPYRWIGVGHSVGAAALLFTEAQQPGTFEWLFCYEPILYTDQLGPVPDLAVLARKRRNDFESVHEAEEYFRSRSLFTTWTKEMLHIYSSRGLMQKSPDSSRLVLKSDPVTGEGQFFERCTKLSSAMLDLLANISVPAVIVRGGLTPGVWRDDHAAYLMKRCFSRQRLITMEGIGHLGVMEQPLQVAALLHKELTEWVKKNRVQSKL